MKSLSLFLLAFASGAQAAVISLVLNPQELIPVPISTDRMTTISFPSPISHIEAAYVSFEPDPPNRVQISYKPGSAFFSVRALTTNQLTSVNVRWEGNTYVFELVPSGKPVLALTLVEPMKSKVSPSDQSPPTNHRLLGMLDTAKAFALLRSQQPALVSDIQYERRRTRYEFGTYEVTLEEVFRFQAEDTLVFRVVITNRSQSPLNYLPQSFRVRVGEQTFHASISDGDGVVPPLSKVPVYFTVSSAADGSPAALSIENDFLPFFTIVPDPSMEEPPPKRVSTRPGPPAPWVRPPLITP